MRDQRLFTGLCSVVAIMLTGAVARADLAAGLAAYWKLNEASGTTATDSIGTFNATLSGGATFVNDATRGNVLSVDGVSDALSNTNPVNVAGGTVLGWVWLAPGAADGGHAFPGQSGPGGQRVYMFSNQGEFTVRLGNTPTASGSTGHFLDDSNWHQIGLTWTETGTTGGGSFEAYFDGQPVKGGSYTGLTTAAAWLSLGSNYDPTDTVPVSSGWTGKISDAGVWTRALSDQEVLGTFTRGTIGPIVPGDINGDGAVTLADYSIFTSNFFQHVPAGPGADLNADGTVNLADFIAFKHDYDVFNGIGGGSGDGLAVPTPEPATLTLVALAFPVWLLLRGRRKHAGGLGSLEMCFTHVRM